MKNFKLWAESLRLSATIPVILLVHISFILAHKSTDWILASEGFLIAVFAMLQNDYIDRFNDIKKGKTFAFEHVNSFRVVLVLGWIIVWLIIFLFLFEYRKLLIPVTLISMFYSYTRKVPYLQNLCVAFASASPLIFANNVTIPLSLSVPGSFMFFGVFLFIFGREIIKDIEDAKTDEGYKRTFVSMGWSKINEEKPMVGKLINIGIFLVLIATIEHIKLSKFLIVKVLYGLGMMLCFSASVAWYFKKDDVILGKKLFDCGMILVLITTMLA